MKKILLFISAAVVCGSLFAQKTVICDWDDVKFSEYTTSVNEEGGQANTFEVDDPLNPGNLVGQFNRSELDGDGNAWVRSTIQNDGWGGIDMTTQKILAIDLYSLDTFDLKILVTTSKGTHLEWKDGTEDSNFKYTEADKGKWKTFVCDWSNSTSIEDAGEIELKFNPDMAKAVTVYIDNLVTASDLSFLTIVSVNELENSISSLSTMPNPAVNTTTIKYSLKQAGNVSLKVYDILGNEVANLVNEYQNVSSQEVKFDVASLNAGLYYYSLNVNGSIQTKKLQVIK